MASLMSKARKPKFDVHLKIADLNNVPLVSGGSTIKWHLPHSIHKEHRGRTPKCPILNHRVEYDYAKVISVRISIDRNNSLSECPIEFEVVQEFSAAGRDEKVTLGHVRLNLSEYVEESEAMLRDASTANALKEALMSPVQKSTHRRKRSSLSNVVPPADEASPRSSRDEEPPAADVQDGVVRRYLLQESKINSTLKVSILMVQVDGDRNYVAPPPKSAPVFGGIAGFVASDAFEPVDVGAATPGHAPSSFTGKSRDVYELQDMYRRALAASWASQPGELPADQCIEDIFGGGEGLGSPPASPHSRHRAKPSRHRRHHSRPGTGRASAAAADDDGYDDYSATPPPLPRRTYRTDHLTVPSTSDDDSPNDGTLRPRDLARLRRQLSYQSVGSDRSVATVLVSGDQYPNHHHHHSTAPNGFYPSTPPPPPAREPFPAFQPSHRREESKITHDGGGLRSRSSSLVSLATATTLGSERDGHRGRGREGGLKRAKEVDEFEVRDDLVAWNVQAPGVQGAHGAYGPARV